MTLGRSQWVIFWPMGTESRGHFFPDISEVYDLCDSGQSPGKYIEKIYGRNCLEVGKYGVHPNYTEDA